MDTMTPLPEDYAPGLLDRLRALRPDVTWSLWGREEVLDEWGGRRWAHTKSYVQGDKDGKMVMAMSTEKMANALFFYQWMQGDFSGLQLVEGQ